MPYFLETVFLILYVLAWVGGGWCGLGAPAEVRGRYWGWSAVLLILLGILAWKVFGVGAH